MVKVPKPRDGLLQKIKILIYSIAAVIVAVAWVLTIAVLSKSGPNGSAIYFYFLLTWISVPALLYLVIAPLWPRMQRFVTVYDSAAIDFAFTILWLAAFCAVQVWTDSGIKDNAKGCSDFEHGDESKCTISHVTAILGIVIFLLWLVAAIISVYSLIHFRRTGSMPNVRIKISKPSFDGGESKAGLDASTGHPQTRLHTPIPHDRRDRNYGSVHTETEDGTHPGRPLSWGQDPPLTAPPIYNQTGLPLFRPVQYSGGPSNETEPNRQSMLGPRRKYNAPATLVSHPAIQRYNSNVGNPYAEDGSTLATGNAHGPYETLREVIRHPIPGPASMHAGGYNSAFHTPLPPGMGPVRNSWYDDQVIGVKGDDAGLGRFAFPQADYSR